MTSKIFLFSIILVAALFSSTITIIQGPTLQKTGNAWTAEFTLNQTTDVAVSIVNIRDSSIVRHLAGGVLGPNAPFPLTPDSLRQKLNWDGKDDLGRTVMVPDSLLRCRVQAGMKPVLDRFVGGNPLSFAMSFHGFKFAPDGSVYIASGNVQNLGTSSGYEGWTVTIRELDAQERYVRTVFPPPADLPSSSVTGLGVNILSDGSWVPKTNQLNFAQLTTSVATTQYSGWCRFSLLDGGAADELVLAEYNRIQVLKTDGGADAQVFLQPVSKAGLGPSCWAFSHDPRYLYFSGAFAGTGSWTTIVANDTGFWADGQVFKVNRATGQAAPFIKVTGFPRDNATRKADIGNGNYFSVLHGVATDDSGHVFVCDRFNKRIGVYDTNAVLLDSLPVRWPDAVAVNRKNGALYVVTHNDTVIHLHKFASWREAAAPTASVRLSSTYYTYHGRPALHVTDANNETLLWVGINGMGAQLMTRIYRDNGTSWSLVKNVLTPAAANDLIDYRRIAIDKTNETVYLTDGDHRMYKITDWGAPRPVLCSTALKKPLWADDVAVSPKGFLYIREVKNPGAGGEFAGPITRWTLDRYHAPAPYANTGDNIITPKTQSRDVGHPTRGLDLFPAGNSVGAVFQVSYGGEEMLGVFPDTGSRDTSLGTVIVRPVTRACGGFKYDLQGNYYVGAKTVASNHVVPQGFAGDTGYRVGVGAVIKYKAGTSGHAMISPSSFHGNPLTQALPTSERIYMPGMAPFGGGPRIFNACVCQGPRFDVDPYGRLFIPNAVTKQVAVVDNNDNPITRFGRYGNIDSWGGLPGPGQTLASPDFPMAFPVTAAASENYIYVADMANWRLMRVRMDYAADNMPELAPHGMATEDEALFKGKRLMVSSSPNPFTSGNRIQIALPPRVSASYGIFDSKGARIRTFTLAPGSRNILEWNGLDHENRSMAAGLYVGRLEMSNGTLLTNKMLRIK